MKVEYGMVISLGYSRLCELRKEFILQSTIFQEGLGSRMGSRRVWRWPVKIGQDKDERKHLLLAYRFLNE